MMSSDGESSVHALPASAIRLLGSSQVITSVCAVVKELLENALDAQASLVDIKLDNFGLDRIEVRDNGTGICKIDAAFVCRPHFTSKLRSTDDLAALNTYGFRGEALGSLCAVADVTLTTRTKNADVSTQYTLNNKGEVVAIKPSPLPQGSTVCASSLFNGLPVRRQWANSAAKRQETIKQTLQLVTAFALVRPDVRLILRHNKQSLWQFNAAGSQRAVLSHVLGGTAVSHLQHVTRSSSLPEVTVELMLPETGGDNVGEMSRSNMEKCFLFANERPVHCKHVEKLVKRYYSACCVALGSRCPVGFVHIRVPPSRIDVNVEPNKTTVFWLDKAEVLIFLESVLGDIYPPKSETGDNTNISETTNTNILTSNNTGNVITYNQSPERIARHSMHMNNKDVFYEEGLYSSMDSCRKEGTNKSMNVTPRTTGKAQNLYNAGNIVPESYNHSLFADNTMNLITNLDNSLSATPVSIKSNEKDLTLKTPPYSTNIGIDSFSISDIKTPENIRDTSKLMTQPPVVTFEPSDRNDKGEIHGGDHDLRLDMDLTDIDFSAPFDNEWSTSNPQGNEQNKDVVEKIQQKDDVLIHSKDTVSELSFENKDNKMSTCQGATNLSEYHNALNTSAGKENLLPKDTFNPDSGTEMRSYYQKHPLIGAKGRNVSQLCESDPSSHMGPNCLNKSDTGVELVNSHSEWCRENNTTNILRTSPLLQKMTNTQPDKHPNTEPNASSAHHSVQENIGQDPVKVCQLDHGLSTVLVPRAKISFDGVSHGNSNNQSTFSVQSRAGSLNKSALIMLSREGSLNQSVLSMLSREPTFTQSPAGVTNPPAKRRRLTLETGQRDISAMFKSPVPSKRPSRPLRKEVTVTFTLSRLRTALARQKTESSEKALDSAPKSLQLIGCLCEKSSLWIGQFRNDLVVFQTIRAKEQMMFHSLMKNHVVESKLLETPVVVNEGFLGSATLYNRLLCCEKTEDEREGLRYFTDPRLQSNGFKLVQNTADDSVLLLEEPRGVPQYDREHLPHLLTSLTGDPALSLTRSRPKPLIQYLKSEAEALVSKMAATVSRDEASQVAEFCSRCLLPSVTCCLHGASYIQTVFSLQDLTYDCSQD